MPSRIKEIDLGTTDKVRDLEFWRHLVPRLEKNIARFEIQILPSSRFAIHMRRVKEALVFGDSPLSASVLTLRRTQQAFQDIRILDLVLTELNPIARWKEQITFLLGGNDLPWRDKNDKARNTEYELQVATTLRQAGFPVTPGEPDIRFTAWRWNLAVAAKRLKSPKGLEDRLKDGIKQLNTNNIPGFVFIDVSVCCLERDQFGRSNNAHHALGLVKAILSETGEYCLQIMRKQPQSVYFLGTVTTAIVPFFVSSGPVAEYVPIGGRNWILEPSNYRSKILDQISTRVARVPLL